MKLLISFSFLLISTFVDAQRDSIDRFLEKQIKEQGIVGLSIGIIKNGKLLKAKGYGFANLE